MALHSMSEGCHGEIDPGDVPEMTECAGCEAAIELEADSTCPHHKLCEECGDGPCPVCKEAAEVAADDEYSWRHR